MGKKGRVNVRFAVVAADGRRSSVWRVITQGDETYLSAASSLGKVKVTLHADGYCQHGPEEPVRRLLPRGRERAAFDRWRQPRGPSGYYEPGYLVYFTGSQLLHQDEDPPDNALLVPSTRDDHEVRVGLFIVEPPVPPPSDGPARCATWRGSP